MADVYRKLYKGGFMRASSVGFIPREWKIGQNDKDPRRTYTKAELLEISLVTVPANPNALMSAKGLGGVNKALEEEVITEADITLIEDAMNAKVKSVKKVEESEQLIIDLKVQIVEISKRLEELEQSDDSIKRLVQLTEEQITVIREDIKQLKVATHYSGTILGGREDEGHSSNDTPENKDILSAVKDGLK